MKSEPLDAGDGKVVSQAERRRFEDWVKQNWPTLDLRYLKSLNEYEGTVQIAWKAWQRFTAHTPRKRA